MSGSTWILIGCLSAAFSAFAIPYGFHLKSKENPPAHAKDSSTSINSVNIYNSGEVIVGNKTSINQHNESNKNSKIESTPPLEKKTSTNYIQNIQTLGGPGTGNGQFRFGGGSDANAGIFVADHFLYVTDWSNKRLQIFKLNNNKIWSYHDSLSPSNNFYSDVYVDSNSNIYLQGQNKIKVFSSKKELVKTLKVNISNFRRFTLDKSNNIFLQSGSDNNVIEKYNYNGELLTSFGGFGNSDGKFDNSGWTADIVTDSTGNVYMQDVGLGKIHKFDNNGVFLKKWDVNIKAYSYMAIDGFDNIYVIEKGYSEINKYNTDGKFIKKYFLPSSVVMGGGSYIFIKNNQLFVSHHAEHNIKIFNLPD